MTDQPGLPPHPAAQPPTQSSTMAIVSLSAGILAYVLVPILGAIVAIVTGHMARKEITNSGGRLTGNGLALAGLILGYIQVFLLVIPLCVIVILALLGPAIGTVFSNIVSNI